MKVEVHSGCTSADVDRALRQIEQTFGVIVARLAAEHEPLENMSCLSTSPSCQHPFTNIPAKVGQSFHKASATCFVDAPVDYLQFASSNWATRVRAYAATVEACVLKIARTRVTADERQILLGIVERASQELSVEVPEVIAEVGPVYVRSTAATDVTPMLSFKPHPSMMPVRPEEIWMHDRGDGVRKETLFKLYNRRSEVIFYREGWFSDDLTIVEHWGTCGSRGEARSHTHTDKSNARKTYDRLKKVAYEAGFRAIPLSEHAKLVVEYPVAETKAETDLERRHALEDLLDELTGWLGLGHVDGSSIGSGTMEVLSYVVDFQTAKAAIVEALSETAFLDFNRIYRAAT